MRSDKFTGRLIGEDRLREGAVEVGVWDREWPGFLWSTMLPAWHSGRVRVSKNYDYASSSATTSGSGSSRS